MLYRIASLSEATKWQMATILLSLASTCAYLILGVVHAPDGNRLDDFHRADSYWYEGIAENGYPQLEPGADLGHSNGADVHQTAWGFFPLYPWTVAVVAEATGCSAKQSMFMLVWVFALVLPVVAFSTFNAFTDTRTAGWSTLGLLCFPFGIYVHLHMTEALYCIALMGSFLAVAKRLWFWSCLCMSMLVLARPNGAIMLLPIGLFILHSEGIAIADMWKERTRLLRAGWPLVFPVAVLAGYCAYQWSMTGTPFAFMAAEKGWGRHFTWPWMGFFRGGDLATQFESWYSLGLVVVAALVARKLPLSLQVQVWLAILLPLCSGTVSDMMRYSSVMFPLFLLAGTFLQQWRWRRAALAASLALQFCWFWCWLTMFGGWLAC